MPLQWHSGIEKILCQESHFGDKPPGSYTRQAEMHLSWYTGGS